MGVRDSWWKQFAAKGNKNSIISLLIVGTALSIFIFVSFLPSSNEGETAQNATLKVDFSFPFQNSYEQELNRRVEKGRTHISVEIPSSNEGETAQNATVKVDLSFPLHKGSEQEPNHGVEEKTTNISVEVLKKHPITEGEHGSKNGSKAEEKSEENGNGLQAKTPVEQSQNFTDRKIDATPVVVESQVRTEEHGNGVQMMRPVEHPQNFTHRKINAPPVAVESQVKSEGDTRKLDVPSSKRMIKKPRRPSSKCDIYSGRWVRDELYPLYPAGECPYINQAFNCKKNGRQDSNYTKWRWQPYRCHLPRLNAMDMLERMRGKRLMFVGDSINHNQWESLICILRTAIPDQKRIHFGKSKDGATSFLAKDYNCSVDFYWAPFLVEQGEIDVGTKNKEILKLDAVENHGVHWKNVDILVFNTGHWWTHGNKVESRDFYMEGNHLYAELEPLDAFKKGLTSWAKWVDKNMDPIKSKVFFRGFSPMHFSSSQWNKPRGHRCNFETNPIFHSSYISPYPERMRIVEEVVGQMKFPVNLMNITRLSDYRKDAHPSIYTARNNKKLTAEEMNEPDKYGDCSHWCLPGLPDIWNELLYGSLLLMESSADAHSH